LFELKLFIGTHAHEALGGNNSIDLIWSSMIYLGIALFT